PLDASSSTRFDAFCATDGIRSAAAPGARSFDRGGERTLVVRGFRPYRRHCKPRGVARQARRGSSPFAHFSRFSLGHDGFDPRSIFVGSEKDFAETSRDPLHFGSNWRLDFARTGYRPALLGRTFSGVCPILSWYFPTSCYGQLSIARSRSRHSSRHSRTPAP